MKEAQSGNFTDSFRRLDELGAIVEWPEGDKQVRLAASYVARAEANESTVIVSQTWSEVARVNEQVRAGLKAKRLLGEREVTVTALEQVDLSGLRSSTPPADSASARRPSSAASSEVIPKHARDPELRQRRAILRSVGRWVGQRTSRRLLAARFHEPIVRFPENRELGGHCLNGGFKPRCCPHFRSWLSCWLGLARMQSCIFPCSSVCGRLASGWCLVLKSSTCSQ